MGTTRGDVEEKLETDKRYHVASSECKLLEGRPLDSAKMGIRRARELGMPAEGFRDHVATDGCHLAFPLFVLHRHPNPGRSRRPHIFCFWTFLAAPRLLPRWERAQNNFIIIKLFCPNSSQSENGVRSQRTC